MIVSRILDKDIPRLRNEEIRDLTKSLGLAVTAEVKLDLSERIEISTRSLTMLFQEPSPELEERHERERAQELRNIAADPARALDAPLKSEGAKAARDTLINIAKGLGIDLDTRKGAAAIGDHAARLLAKKAPRIDAIFRGGVEQVFAEIIEAIHGLAPAELEGWPSNTGEPCKATEFALAYIQIVVDRARERLSSPSPRAQRWLRDLLNKDHRALLEGLRKERQWHRRLAYLREDQL